MAPGLILKPMDSIPQDANEAVEALLQACPELVPAWDDLCESMEENTAETVGIYLVFGQMILPLVLYALDGHPDPDSINGRRWMEMAARHRATFRHQDHWRNIPFRGDAHLDDLLRRLYETLDLWAASPNVSLRHAVYTEMAQDGYVDLTVNDLVRYAGPVLRSMAERRSPEDSCD